jgi:hypothetical protein
MKYGQNKIKSMARAKMGRGSHHRNRINDGVHGPVRANQRVEMEKVKRDPEADVEFDGAMAKSMSRNAQHNRGGRKGLDRWAERVVKDVRKEDQFSKVKAMLIRVGMNPR